MNFSKLSSRRHVKIIEKSSGIKLWPNQLIILLSSHPINTSKPAPGIYRYPGKQVWQLHAWLVCTSNPTSRDGEKKTMKCVLQDLGLGSRDGELREIRSSRDRE